jgi:hypothetical protein
MKGIFKVSDENDENIMELDPNSWENVFLKKKNDTWRLGFGTARRKVIDFI